MRRSPRYLCRSIFHLFIVFSLSGIVSVCSFAESASDSVATPFSGVNNVFDLANGEYKAGNFRDALELYKSLISSDGIRTADIHYNIGNTEFKLRNYGRAIVSYRRAQLITPRDQDIIANLNHVREMTIDRIDQAKSTELFREIFFFHYFLGKTETEISFICAYVTFVSLLIIQLIRKSTAMRRLAFIAFFLALMFGSSLIIKWYDGVNSDQAVVVVEETEVRTGPGRNYMVSFGLHDGAEVEVHKSQNGWCQIELPDGRRGWLNDAHIENV